MTTVELIPHQPFGPQTIPDGVHVATVSSPVGPLTALWARADAAGAPGTAGAAEAARTAESEPRGTALFIPGFTGSKEDFLDVLPLFAARGWNVLAYSQRGQADSAAPRGRNAYRLEDFAADAIAIARRLGNMFDGPCSERSACRVHLLGHSFGGIVARDAVLRRPDLFASLTVFSSGAAAISATAERRAQFARLEQLAADPALRDLAPERRPGAPTEPLTDPAAEMKRLRGLASSLDNLVAAARILAAGVDRTAELAASEVPVHVIYGANDPAWPHEQYDAEAAALGARHTVVPSAEHNAQNENPVPFVGAVTDFWAAVS